MYTYYFYGCTFLIITHRSLRKKLCSSILIYYAHMYASSPKRVYYYHTFYQSNVTVKKSILICPFHILFWVNPKLFSKILSGQFQVIICKVRAPTFFLSKFLPPHIHLIRFAHQKRTLFFIRTSKSHCLHLCIYITYEHDLTVFHRTFAFLCHSVWW